MSDATKSIKALIAYCLTEDLGDGDYGAGLARDALEELDALLAAQPAQGERLTRVEKDDEIVAEGTFHMERMDDGHIWFQVAGVAFDLTINGKGKKIVWEPQDADGWDELHVRPRPNERGS